jgi:hypothetical protein
MSKKKWRDKLSNISVPPITLTDNQKSWIEKHGVIWAMILLVLGAVFGSVVTVYYGNWQMQQEDIMTAQSLYNELSSPTNQIPVMALLYENKSSGIDDMPLYPLSSVLPIVKTKMGRFSDPLRNNISQYDYALYYAEQNRLKLWDIIKISPNVQSSSVYDTTLIQNKNAYFSNMEYYIFYCNQQIPIIEKQLHDEFGVS